MLHELVRINIAQRVTPSKYNSGGLNMEYLALNNGIQMPLAGFGTFMLNKETCTNAVTATIETGHITFSTLRNILYIIELIS